MSPKTRNFAARIARTKAGAGTHVRGQLWYAMRVLHNFTQADLQAVAEVDKRRSVTVFLLLLRRAGYLRVRAGHHGRHEPHHYTLIRDSGPKCPALVNRGKAIYDHNTDTTYALKGTTDANQ